MKLPPEIWEKVRQRAHFACEYCGVTETDVAGLLTVDHQQPKSLGGSDTVDNLIYCCSRCNLYKADYWATEPEAVPLWNPRQDEKDTHFQRMPDGTLHPLTPKGSFTILRLRLNRPQLVAHRLKKLTELNQFHLLTRFQSLTRILLMINTQQEELAREQQTLLHEQQRLLRLLLAQNTRE